MLEFESVLLAHRSQCRKERLHLHLYFLLLHSAPLVGSLRLHIAVESDVLGVEARLNRYLAFRALLERDVIAGVEVQLVEGVV